MLVPVIVRANYKVATSLTVTLETIAGANLPLVFPEVQVFNRTPTACSLSISGQKRLVYSDQSDPDFDGTVLSTLVSSFALTAGQSAAITGLNETLLPSAYAITTEITFTNGGPAAQVYVSLLLRGLVETSLQVDPLIIVNV